jgi:HK97 family phage major capsid protein
MSQNAELAEAVNRIIERQGAMDKAISALKTPANPAGVASNTMLSPEQVMALMTGLAVAGNDGAGYRKFSLPGGYDPLFPGRRPLFKGVGMGEALCEVAKGANPNLGRPDFAKLEKDGWSPAMHVPEGGRKNAWGHVTKAALAEGSGVTGGYIVPPAFSQNLLRIAVEEAIVRQYATVMPMTTRTLTIPTLDVTTAQAAGTPPQLGGIFAQWQPEASTIGESEPTFRQMELTAWDLVMLCVASNQLLADNGVALDALLTQLFKQALAWFSDYAFLQGRGAGNSMPLGVLNSPATLQVTRAAASSVRFADIATMLSKVYYLNWQDVIWLAHPSVLPQLLQMTDNSAGSGAGRLVWLNPAPPSESGPVQNKFTAQLLGRPLFITDKLPALGTTGCIGCFCFPFYVIGDRMELQIEASQIPRFTTNQMMWRLIARMDGRSWLNNPVTLSDGTFTQSPFVILTQ